jgi:hypothetical protein
MMGKDERVTGAGAVKWAWRYGALNADDFDSLDEAVRSADYASDNGEEFLVCIEVPAEGRIIPESEVWKLAVVMRPEPAPYKRPNVTVVLTAPDGEKAEQHYVERADAEEDAAHWRRILGDARVSIRSFR